MKKIPLLILILVIVVTGFIVGIMQLTGGKKNIPFSTTPSPTINPNITPIPMRFSFNPSTIRLTSSKNTIEADIVLDAGPQDTSGVTIDIMCDPKRVTNVKLTQKKDRYSALSYALSETTTTFDIKECKGGITLSIPDTSPEQRGRGVVAHLSAIVTGTDPTEIVILPSSKGFTRNALHQFEITRVNLELTK